MTAQETDNYKHRSGHRISKLRDLPLKGKVSLLPEFSQSREWGSSENDAKCLKDELEAPMGISQWGNMDRVCQFSFLNRV